MTADERATCVCPGGPHTPPICSKYQPIAKEIQGAMEERTEKCAEIVERFVKFSNGHGAVLAILALKEQGNKS